MLKSAQTIELSVYNSRTASGCASMAQAGTAHKLSDFLVTGMTWDLPTVDIQPGVYSYTAALVGGTLINKLAYNKVFTWSYTDFKGGIFFSSYAESLDVEFYGVDFGTITCTYTDGICDLITISQALNIQIL